MDIFINNEPLQFELKEDLPLSKIIDNISTWAAEKDYYILEYHVDSGSKKTEPFSNEINKLEIEIGDIQDLTRATLNELLDYLNRVGSFLSNKIHSKSELTENETLELIEGIDCINNAAAVLSGQTGNNISNTLNELKKIAKTAKTEQDILNLLQHLTYIRFFILDTRRQFQFKFLTPDELDECKKKFIDKIDKIETYLEKMTTEFTIGKEAEAILSLNDLIEIIYDGLTVLHLTSTAPETAEKIASLLKDLMDSLDKKDMVTVADILDFDLRDSLKELKQYA
ncbi:MAG: hypothetical protein OEZ22_13225 [Spirochaetia bacterium]|nr:hypothetical protein [Spirochaetia bacterium]